MISHINIRIFRILVWAQTPSSGQTDFSRAFEGWLHPFVHDTCLVSSLRSICGILRCGSLDGAQYHAGDLVIAWETALFVFVIIGCFKLPLRIALENILAECQCAPCPKVQAKISGGYIYSVVNPECCADCSIARGTAQKGLVLEKNALNRLVHNLLELISKGYNPTDLSQQPSCNFPGKQIKILFHNLYVD